MSTADDQESTAERPAGGRHARASSRARRIGGAAKAGAEQTTDATSPKATAATVARVTLDKKPVPASPAGPPGAADEPRRAAGTWVPGLIGLLGTAAAIVFLVLGVIASHGLWWGNTNAVADQRGAVLAAAKSCMATMNTYDYRKLDEAEKAGLACTTGKLTAQYKTAIEKVIKPQAAKVQFTQTAQILHAGVETVSKDGSQWTVLVFGQLSTTNSATGTDTPRLDLFSARAVLQQDAGKWRIASYEYAPAS